MKHRADDGRPTTDDSHQFAAALAELKDRGSALLVAGHVPDETYVRACSRLLGDDAAGPRHRLFVTTDTDLPSVTDRFTDSLNSFSPATSRRICWAAQSRHTATTAVPDEPRIPTTYVRDGGLGTLGVRISEAIDDIDSQADGLESAELRLCFDSLDTLLSDCSHAVVFRFLHVLIGRLRSVRGMGHFHLPVARDSEVVQFLAELFDATIELRLADTTLQHRWHLHEPELTSSWLPIADP